MKSGNILMLWIVTFFLLCIPIKADRDYDLLRKLLNIHNKFRSGHHKSRLYLDFELCDDCSVYAKESAEKKNLIHSMPNPSFGENICITSSKARNCIKKWYSEIKYHNFKNPRPSPLTKSFTQLIWKSSTELGIGVAVSSNNKTFVVARYKPAGNVGTVADLRENVPEKLTEPTATPMATWSTTKRRRRKRRRSFSHKTQISKYLIICSWIFPTMMLLIFYSNMYM